LLHHKHISEKRKYDIIDLDCFGLPFKFFPQIYMLLNDKAFLYVTSVNYYTPILNWRRKMQFQSYFKKNKPTYKDYSDFIIDSGKVYLMSNTLAQKN
jgi:tRNA G26 N,N-dimethylase Trm1